MTAAEWLDYAVQIGLLGSAILVVQRGQAAQAKKLDEFGRRLDAQAREHGQSLTEIKLGLRDCVKWTDLDRELDPMRGDIRAHESRITIVETRCAEQHHKGRG